MAQADPNAGLIYVCNPNNPTGSITPKEDIEYLVANKPKDAIVLLDEAYIHLSKTAEPGFAAGRRRQGRDHPPDVLEALRHGRPAGRRGPRAARPARQAARAMAPAHCRSPAWSAPSPASRPRAWSSSGARAIADIREETAGWLDKKGFAVLPSEANMLMVDVHRPGREVFQAHAQGEGRHRPDLAVDAESRADHDRHP